MSGRRGDSDRRDAARGSRNAGNESAGRQSGQRAEGTGNGRETERRDHKGRQRSAARHRGDRTYSQQAPSQRARHTDQPRAVAFGVLRDVDSSDSYANLVLPARLRHAQLSGRDAAFATELTYGTLRMRGRYDAVLGRCVDRPLDELDPALLDALRLGAHQLLSMRVPAHAAVSQTVALVRAEIGAGAGALANAVLRKVSVTTWDEWRTAIEAESPSSDDLLAVVESHPVWVVRALRDGLVASGRDAGEVADLLAADNIAPRVSLVARPGLIGADDLVAQAPQATLGGLSPYAVTLPGADPGEIPAVRQGRAGVQDEGSQLVALALLGVPIDGRDQRWLDLCAGPGGKTALLAAMAAQRGARVVANEVSEHRTRLVRENLKAVPATAVEAVLTGDGRLIGAQEPDAYDRILVDAPCTGLGALRRRPESRWRRSPSDVPGLMQVQRELLLSALDAVRPGGVVGYVTCSPHIAETKVVVDDALRRRSDIVRLDAWAAVASVVGDRGPLDIPAATLQARDGEAGRSAQLWPHIHGTDAMHLTLLRKRG